MRRVSIRAFRKNLASEIRELPFELERNGVVVAVVCTPENAGFIEKSQVGAKSVAVDKVVMNPGPPVSDKKAVVSELQGKMDGIVGKSVSKPWVPYFKPQPKGGK